MVWKTYDKCANIEVDGLFILFNHCTKKIAPEKEKEKNDFILSILVNDSFAVF